MKKLYAAVILISSCLITISCSDSSPVDTVQVYSLTVSAEPSEGGTVSPSQGEYDSGTEVEITASPNEHWVFQSWQGGHTGRSNPATVTMNSDKDITALFVKREYPLTITIEGEGSVEERVVQQRITDYEHETIVELTANADDGWLFSHWEGDLEGSENPATIEIDGEKSVTAVFERRDYPLTINVVGEGAVTEQIVQAKTTEYPYETIVELTATPSTGWVFSHWEGDLTGDENPAQLEIDDAKEVTAVFELGFFEINYTIEGEGSVNENLLTGEADDDGRYQYESTVELTAEAADGWRFVSWGGDLQGDENPTTIEIESDKDITVVFERRDYELTINIEGEGSVAEEVVQAKTTTYPFETIVELTATPSTGWVFSHWEGDLTGDENPAQIEIDNAKVVTAVFERDYFELILNIDGEGSVNENLLTGEADDDGRYQYESTVELTAEAADGWRFVSWGGDLQGDENPTTIEIESDKDITVVFERRDYELTINIEGEGSVAEEVVQAKTSTYPFETIVELTATPSTGWVFSHWEGDLTGDENPAQIEIDDAKVVKAVFERDYFELILNIDGEGTVDASLISGDQTGEGYEFESEVEITATASNGWHFSNWSGDINSTENPVTLTVEGETNITAIFKRNEYTLTITTDGDGTVSETLLEGSATDNGYLFETVVELEAIPEDGWEFSEWSQDITGSDNPTEIFIGENKTVTAVFVPIEYVIDITIEGEGTISEQLISGEAINDGYVIGSVVELTVETEGDWKFVHWSGDIEGTDNPTQVTISGDVSATAHLDENPFAGGNGSELYPYLVEDIEQLQQVRNYADAHFLQVSNIDAVSTQNWNGGNGFIPIGDETINFSGVYDGNDFVINSLFINRSESRVGLFGYVRNAILRNINLQNVDITGGLYTGGLAGWHESSIGSNSLIVNSRITGNITGTTAVGGLVGHNFFGAVVESSWADVGVTGNNNVGGLIGNNWANVKSSYATGIVTASDPFGTGTAGGLVGNNTVSIEQSFASAQVIGQEGVGGLAGHNSGVIENSYALGTADGDTEIGGLAGTSNTDGEIILSFSAVLVTGNEDVGGLIGVNGGSIVSSYWDTVESNEGNATGRGSSNGANGLTTSQMQGTAAQNNMPEFDWVNIWMTTTGYPILRWQN